MRNPVLPLSLLFLLVPAPQSRAARPRKLAEIPVNWTLPVRAVAVGPKGKLLAAGGDHKEVVIVKLATRKVLWRLAQTAKVSALAFSPDGKTLAVGVQGFTVRLYSATTGRVLRQIQKVPGWPRSLAFSPKGDLLAVAGQSQHIALFDPVTGLPKGLLTGHTSWVNEVAFSPDGQLVAGAGWDHAVRIFDVATRKLLRSAYGHKYAVTSLVFLKDGKRLVSSSDDQSLRLFNAISGVSLKRLRGPAMTRLGLARQAGRLVAGTWKGRLVVMQLPRIYPLKQVQAHKGAVLGIGIAPNGRVAVTGGHDGKLKLWRSR